MRYLVVTLLAALAALIGAAVVVPAAAATKAPQATYDVNQWVQLHSAASLAGALQRCAESGDHQNRTHERITRVFGAILKALEKGNPDNQQMWQMALRAYQIGLTRGLYVPVVPDPSDGGVKFDDHVAVQTAEACKAAEGEGVKLLSNGGALHMSVGPEA